MFCVDRCAAQTSVLAAVIAAVYSPVMIGTCQLLKLCTESVLFSHSGTCYGFGFRAADSRAGVHLRAGREWEPRISHHQPSTKHGSSTEQRVTRCNGAVSGGSCSFITAHVCPVDAAPHLPVPHPKPTPLRTLSKCFSGSLTDSGVLGSCSCLVGAQPTQHLANKPVAQFSKE